MMEKTNYITKYIPNILTILSLTSGFSSIRFSMEEKWEIAIYLILLASVFDFFDGWFARKLNKDSNFGAELDSLSDFVSFGVAPSILVFFMVHIFTWLNWMGYYFVFCYLLCIKISKIYCRYLYNQ